MSAERTPRASTRPPGARKARRITRIAKSRLSRVRWTLRSLLPASARGRCLPLRIRAGHHFTDEKARGLPIVVIVAQGLGEGAAEDLAREVGAVQVSTRSFRPLFVIDGADFAPFRQRGYVVERIMRPEGLAAVNPADDYGEYLDTRIAAIARGYRAAAVVHAAPDRLQDLRGALPG